jgi:hypothetical protein
LRAEVQCRLGPRGGEGAAVEKRARVVAVVGCVEGCWCGEGAEGVVCAFKGGRGPGGVVVGGGEFGEGVDVFPL